jgi:hypothetical protein
MTHRFERTIQPEAVMADIVDIDALRALLEKATKGPVAWMGGPHNIYFATTHSGRIFIMGFKRMGINGAQPVFPVNGRLVPASDMLKFDVGDPSVTGMAAAKADSSVYRYDIRDIDNPEAQLLVAARNALPALLDELEGLRADLGRTVTHASRLAMRETELRAALLKICEPITVAGDADTITACQDLHEIICEIAQEALTKG